MSRPLALVMLLSALLAVSLPAGAASTGLLREVDFEQKLDARLPTGRAFVDASGTSVALGDLLGERPAFLVLAYFRCPNLCGTMLRTVARSLAPLPMTAGRDFDVIVIGIDPQEGPDDAAEARREMLAAYGRPGSEAGWHVLTGEPDAVAAVAERVGFRYVYDEDLGQYIHPAGLILLTPDGRVARYFYGLDYLGRDLRLGLLEASGGRVGTPVDQVLLLCYGYDPSTGRYTLLITNVVRIAGTATALALAAFVAFHLVRDRRRSRARRTAPGG